MGRPWGSRRACGNCVRGVGHERAIPVRRLAALLCGPSARTPAGHCAVCARARACALVCVLVCVCACGGMRCGSSVERRFASAARSPIGSGTGIPRRHGYPTRRVFPTREHRYGTRLSSTHRPTSGWAATVPGQDLLPRSADRPGHCGSARALRGRARSALLHHHLVLACEHLHAQRCRGPRGPLPSGSAPAEPLHSCCGGMYAAPTYDRREHYSSAAEAVGRQRMLVGSHQRDMRSRRHDHPSRLCAKG